MAAAATTASDVVDASNACGAPVTDPSGDAGPSCAASSATDVHGTDGADGQSDAADAAATASASSVSFAASSVAPATTCIPGKSKRGLDASAAERLMRSPENVDIIQQTRQRGRGGGLRAGKASKGLSCR